MLYNIKIAIAYIAEKQYLCTRITNPLVIAIMKLNLKKSELVARFNQLLEERGLRIAYIAKYSTAANIEHAPLHYWHWYSWAMQIAPALWTLQAFPWTDEERDPNEWAELHNDWCEWLAANLNN